MTENIKTEKRLNHKSGKKITANILFYAACVMFSIVFVLPFFWSLLASFKTQTEITGIFSFFPKVWTMESYRRVFAELPVERMFLNSILTTLAGLFTNLFFGTLAAYSFSKLRFRGHKVIFNIMLLSLMIPGVITLIPTFIVITRFPLFGGNSIMGYGGAGLYGSLWAVILPGAIGVYGIFFMRQFFMGLPDELAESARIDGAGEFIIFYKIYVPLVIPGLLTLGLFTFMGGWNNYMWPSIVLGSRSDKWLLTMSFQVYQNSLGLTEYAPLMVLSIIMAAPILIIYSFSQKYFIKGVAVGSLKG